jgi:hypothetical protein
MYPPPTHAFMGTAYMISTGIVKPHRSCIRSSSLPTALTPFFKAISSMSFVGWCPLVVI